MLVFHSLIYAIDFTGFSAQKIYKLLIILSVTKLTTKPQATR